MKAVLAAVPAAFLCLACVTGVGPTMVLHQGADTLTLMTAPCSRKVKELLKPEVRERFKSARAIVDGQFFKACWAVHDKTRIFVIYDDGDANLIPISLFVKTASDPRAEPVVEDWRKSA